jgi:hypothetical protein
MPVSRATFVLLFAAVAAHAAEPVAGLRAPARLTAGAADEFLGAASADGSLLYFISNRNATAQIFTQTPTGTPTLLFDEGADTSFPRLSPDGKTLAYLSTRTDATGDICLRTLPDGDRRCLTGPQTAETTAFWFPDGKSLGVVQRGGMHGDWQLRRLDPQGGDLGLVVPDAGISSPALHPDAQWLAWLPAERASQDVGVAFAVRPAQHLRLARIGQPGHEDIVFALPGVTGFPAFAADGRWLYFAQHLSDTNQDGRIDGHDHSVLFRARFDANAAHPLAGAWPEQLTSAHWNCQYPAPGRDALLTTCEVEGSLDLYRLPLDGALSADWSEAKLQEVFEATGNPWERLMVLSHQVQTAQLPADRVRFLRHMTRVHLQLGELASVDFFARRAAQLLPNDAALAAWTTVVLEIVGHRLDERRLAGGTLDDRFLTAQRDRVRRLGLWAKQVGAVRDLARLAQVEVLDVMGEERRALDLLQSVPLTQVADPFVLYVYADKALNLLRSLGDREQILARLAQLAEHPVLEAPERLDFAERFVADLGAGAGLEERRKRVQQWLPQAEKEGELAFRLQVELHLLTLTQATQEPVRVALFQLYKKYDQPERRRALVAASSRRAAEADCADLLYQFANTWVSQIAEDKAARAAAVALYRQVGLDKAWIHRALGEIGDSRGTFWGLTLQTDDLEAHAGFIEARLAEGKTDVQALYAKRFGPDDPVRHFAEAWLLARDVTQAADDATLRAAEAHADAAAVTVNQSVGLSHLRGYLRHQRFLQRGDRQAGIEAVGHYQMALDLANGRPRYEAALLSNLALLQGALGNHALAGGLLERRLRLPTRGPGEALTLLLARSRALFHTGEAQTASQEADAALALVDATPELADRRWLVTDRAALMAYAADKPHRARELYVDLLARAPAEADAHLDAANRLRWTLMAGAAAAADNDGTLALKLLADAERRLAGLQTSDLALGKPPTTHSPGLRREDFTLLLSGLQAEGARLANAPELAQKALLDRRDALQAAFADRDEEELLVDLAGTELRLANTALAQGDAAAARLHLEAGLEHATTYQKRNGSIAPEVRIALLQAYAAACLSGKLGATPASVTAIADLRAVYAFLCERANPARARERFQLGLYLAVFSLDFNAPARPAGGAP